MPSATARWLRPGKSGRPRKRWKTGAGLTLAAGGFAFALGGAAPAGALPMDPPKGPGEALTFEAGPPGLEEGPPGMGNVPSFVDLPVRVERLEDDELLLQIAHPRADELGLEKPFLTLRLGPLNSPRIAQIVPEPGAALLLAGVGVAAILTRRHRRT